MKHLWNYREVVGTLIAFAIVLTPVIAGAQLNSGTNDEVFNSSNTGGGDPHRLQNPLGNINSFCKLVIAIVNAAMIIGIPIAILFIVWAGFKFIVAQGNPGALTDARRNFLNVIIGIAIFVGASLIGTVIIRTLQQLGVQGINSC